MTLERADRILDLLGVGLQLLAEFGQAIAGRMALGERTAEAFFKRG